MRFEIFAFIFGISFLLGVTLEQYLEDRHLSHLVGLLMHRKQIMRVWSSKILHSPLSYIRDYPCWSDAKRLSCMNNCSPLLTAKNWLYVKQLTLTSWNYLPLRIWDGYPSRSVMWGIGTVVPIYYLGAFYLCLAHYSSQIKTFYKRGKFYCKDSHNKFCKII